MDINPYQFTYGMIVVVLIISAYLYLRGML